MTTPIAMVAASSAGLLVLTAQAGPVIVQSQTGITFGGHTLEFWAQSAFSIIVLFALIWQKIGDKKESTSAKILALATQRADQAEKLQAATKLELDLYREQTHARLEKAHADLMTFTLENEKLRQMTDMSPILKHMEAEAAHRQVQNDQMTAMTSALTRLVEHLTEDENERL